MAPSNAPAGTGIGTLSADEGHTEIPSGGIAGQYSAQINAASISLSVATAFTITAVEVSPPPPASPPAPPAPSVPPTPVSLPSGVHLITGRGNGVDGGFGSYNPTLYGQLYPTNGVSGQQWRWNGSTFSNVLIAAGGSSDAAGPLLADAGDGTTTEKPSGDTCTVSPSVNDDTIRDSRSGKYCSVVSNALAMSATQTLWTIAALASPPPTGITLTPVSVTIANNVPAGTPLAAAAVTKSDGAQFSVTLTTGYTDFFAISGLDIVTARALTTADDGARATVIAASQGGKSLSMSLSV